MSTPTAQLLSGAPARPVAATIAVVLRDDQTLLVRRANPPDAGRWGFPGGKIEQGETVHAAALRELREETGVTAEALDVLTALDAFDRDENGVLRRHYILIVVRCRWIAGEPVAGDDALEAAWFPVGDLDRRGLAMSRDVVEIARQAADLAEASRR